ncbi:cyclin-dependent kinase inhibitor 1 [Girardinichthys multiradiatus]|uniref:cyclin-dependent kinase inhibitor 1 n=1 Tax=Girardinichthys multiradiatus TaxID=208333 RepID=UPI001FAB8A2B|nr:cyclin-dependent kinase inhibitor 1 [Girardinichthys multiradiatus]
MCGVMASHKLMLSSLGGNRPVRRNLFGPVDQDQLWIEFQAILRKDLDDMSKRWGFDFKSDKPLESSDFKWTSIPETRVPLHYRSCMLAVGQSEGLRLADRVVLTKTVRIKKENIPQMPEKCAIELEGLERTSEKGDKAGLKRKQTNITDFYQAKRRVVGMPTKSGE